MAIVLTGESCAIFLFRAEIPSRSQSLGLLTILHHHLLLPPLLLTHPRAFASEHMMNCR